MEITFSFEHDYELPSVASPQDIYVLSVPFGAGAIKWKESLEQKGIKFDATIHPQLPLIEFALKDLSPKVVDKLAAKFGENINDLDDLNIPKDLRIIPPADHSWATSRQDSGVGALAYNLFTEEVCQQLQDFQFDEIKVLGIKYNDFANENFASKQWKKRSVTLEVGVFELPESHPEFYRYNGTPILQIDGKNLGTFAPDSPKLPIGATFAATLQPDGSSVILKVNPESINLPEIPLPESEPKLDTAGQFRAIHRELWRKEMFDNLVGAIATTYEQRQANQSASNEIEQFKIGSHWTAYVQPSGDFIVRNEGKRTICRGNLQTCEEIFPLSEERASELEAMILERERLLHRKHELSNNRHHISSQDIELN
ncbi:hypothetical protein [Nostoc sp. KVJ3]|uniref:hypothetical protein n=1 Tax=Nostoc sp. KVJ3 TaxID=457945 RepID=UPI0022388300|nr:hypothetical protein [Nostoc sp. KVJ3]